MLEDGGGFVGKIARGGDGANRGMAPPLREGHGFDLFLQMGHRFGGTEFDDGETDRGLEHAEQHELRRDGSEAELARAALMEKSLEGAIPESLSHGLKGGVGSNSEGSSFP